MSYDKLLFANRASNRPPRITGVSLEQLKTIRNLEDVRRLHKNIEGKKVIINIGGGFRDWRLVIIFL